MSNLLLESSFGKSALELYMDSRSELALATAMTSDPFSGPISAPGNFPGLWRKGSTVVSMWESER